MKNELTLLDWHLAARATAICLALAATVWAFAPSSSEAPIPQASTQLEQTLPVAQAGGIIPTLFQEMDSSDGPADLYPTSPPELVGLAGRLPDDVEALIKDANGETMTLRVGQSAEGWTLISVAADRAVFEKGREQAVRTLD